MTTQTVSARPSQTPLYVCPFSTDPLTSGWRYIATDKQRQDMEYLPSEGSYASKGGRLEGPTIPCAPKAMTFYRLSFASRFTENGYYALLFQDSAGKDQTDDMYGGIDPTSDWQPQQCCFRGRQGAKTFRLQFISHGTIAVRDVMVEQVELAEVRQWADRLYARLPQLNYAPPRKRWQRLTHTMQRLRSGGELRVVQLGDSIVNDTNNSCWDALVARHYPNCQLQLITSVRGDTGCSYFRQDQVLKSHVLDHHPELLILGGISHRQDLASIREVICKTQAASDCEILLCSGPMGDDWRGHDPSRPDAALPTVRYAGDPFNAELTALAVETGVEFLDMNTVWHQYLAASGKRWQYFHRDRVHANDRGRQILARILERYFAEK